MNLTNVNRLLKHYKELKGDELEMLDWSWQGCAGAKLAGWGLFGNLGRWPSSEEVAGVLGIDKADGYRLVYATHRTGGVVYLGFGPGCRDKVVKMLEFLAANGYVAWPGPDGEMKLT